MTFSADMRRLSDCIARRYLLEGLTEIYLPNQLYRWGSEPRRYPKARTLQQPF